LFFFLLLQWRLFPALSDRVKKTKIKDFGEKLLGSRKDLWKATPSLKDFSFLTDDELIRVVVKARLWTSKEFKQLPLLGVDPECHFRLSRLRRAIHPAPVRLPEWTVREMCILYYETLIFVKEWAATLRSYQDFEDRAESLLLGYFLVPREKAEGQDEEAAPQEPDVRISPLQGKFLDWEGQMETLLGSKFVKRLKSRVVLVNWGVRRPPRSIEEIIASLKQEYHFDPDTFFTASRILYFGESAVKEGCSGPTEFRLVEAASFGLKSLSQAECSALRQRLHFNTRHRAAKLSWKPLEPVRSGLPEHFDPELPPEAIARSLHVRGGEFGNWVPGSERSKKLRLLAEAFHDLAEILGLSMDEVSLGGKLGLAMGSRGRGGRNPAIAHFEPWSNVINLTRQKSDGSLCHEWAHALDLVLGRIHTASQPMTGRFIRYPFLSKEVFPRVKANINNRTTWKDGPKVVGLFKDSPLPQEVIQPIAAFANEFYAHYLLAPEAKEIESDETRCHTSYVEKIENLLRDLLVIPFALGRIKEFPPATETDLEQISKACRIISEAKADPHQSVETLSAAVKNIVGQPLGTGFRQRLLNSIELVQRVRFQSQSVVEGKGDWRVPSHWRRSLLRETSYWKRPEELFARAVEVFVFDQMASRNVSNTFLLSPQVGDAMWSHYYPSGVERARFNLLLANFFHALQKHGVLANLVSDKG